MTQEFLAAELQQPQYAEMEDAAAAAALNALSLQVIRQLPVNELFAWAMGNGLYTRLDMAINTPETPVTLRSVCRTLLALINAPAAGVTLVTVLMADGTEYPATMQMLNALQAAGLLAVTERTALHTMCMMTTSRAAQLGLGYVSPGDVQQARNGGYA